MKYNTVLKNRIGKLLLFALVLALFAGLGAPAVSVSADTQDATEFSEGTMKLRGEEAEVFLKFGVQGKARYGRSCLMRGTVTSSSPFFEGSMEFLLQDTEGNTQSYEVQIATDAAGKGTFSMVLPMHRYVTLVRGVVKDAAQKQIAERQIPLERISVGNASTIGVLGSEEASHYSYLSAFGCYVLTLSTEDFAERPEGYEFFDILVLDGYEEGMLPAGCMEALKEWTASGGALVIGTGAKGEQTLAALSRAGLFSGTVQETVDIQTNYGMDEEMQQKLNARIIEYETKRQTLLDYQKDNGTEETAEGTWGKSYLGTSVDSFYTGTSNTVLYATETAKLCRFAPDGAVPALSEQGETLCYVQPYGEGKIEWFAVSLSRKTYDYYGVSLVYLMQQNQSALGAARLLDVSYDGMMGAENYWLSDYLETKPVLGIGKFVVLFALYLLVAGPGFYVLFQKTGKRTWMFSAVPAVALAFFVFVAAAGSDTRVTKPYASYTELIEQNENTAEAQLAVQLAAPTGRTWNVSFAGEPYVQLFQRRVTGFYDTLYLSYDSGRYKNGQTAGVRWSEGKTELSVSGLPAFSDMNVMLTYPVELPELIEDNISLSENSLLGTVTNVSDMEFSNSYIYYNGVLVSAGKMEAGETIVLSQEKQRVLPAKEDMNYAYAEILEEEGDTPEFRLAQNYIYWHLGGVMEEARFIGITEQASEENPVAAPAEESYTAAGGLTLYSLLLTVEETDGEEARYD